MSIEYYLIDDIWLEIKGYLFHNINKHGKHLKIYNKDIKKYNKVLKNLPKCFLLENDYHIRLVIRPSFSFPSVTFIYGINYKLKNKVGISKTKFVKEYFEFPKEYLQKYLLNGDIFSGIDILMTKYECGTIPVRFHNKYKADSYETDENFIEDMDTFYKIT